MECRVGSDDDYLVGQLPHPRAQSAAIAITAVAAVAMLTGCGSGGASAVTTLTGAHNAQVVSANGRTVAGVPGTRLHRGDIIRTGADGSAILSTAGRTAYLGSDGDYTVTNGAVGVLQRGAFVVDARRGPQLQLQVGSFSVRTNRSAVRVEQTFAVRIGTLAGRPTRVTSIDASLTIPTLHQVVAAGRALPTQTTPLVLTDDDAERRVIPDLVFDDRQLMDTAVALNQGTEGRTIVAVAQRAGLRVRFGQASLRTASPAAVTPPVSEAALPVAIARAAAGNTATAAMFREHYEQAAQERAQGGSWAVVAHLNGTDATATSEAIDALLGVAGSSGPALVQAPGSVTNGTSASPAPSGTPTSRPGAGNGAGNPSPGPSPTPTPSPSGGVQQPIADLVDTLLGILPTPTPEGGSRSTSPTPDECKILGLLTC